MANTEAALEGSWQSLLFNHVHRPSSDRYPVFCNFFDSFNFDDIFNIYDSFNFFNSLRFFQFL